MSDPFIASYILLWLLTIVLAVALLATCRQVALLTRRFPFTEVPKDTGPDLGSLLPPVQGMGIAGDEITVGPPFRARSVFIFMEENCPTCEEALPWIGELASDLGGDDLWIVLDRSPTEDGIFGESLDGRTLIAPDVFTEWGIERVPYALVALADGKLEAKGQLGGGGRLRETLGLAARANGGQRERIPNDTPR